MKRLLSLLAVSAAAVAGIGTALPAAAQFAKPEDAIKYRQSALSVMGTHFGRIGAVVQGKAPYDPKATIENANIVLAMSKLPYVAFVEGSDKGGNTKAKPEIWTERAKFDAAAGKMQEEAVKFAAATKGGNLDQIKAAAGALGGACKACHDDFRAK